MLPVEFVGGPRGFDEYFQHPGEEFVYVVHGQIEIDIEGELHSAAAGDSVYYAGGLRHRWRTTSDERSSRGCGPAEPPAAFLGSRARKNAEHQSRYWEGR